MVEEWKNDRAEASMKQFDKENMAKALKKVKEKEDKAWADIAASLYVGSEREDVDIDWVLGLLREKYALPVALPKKEGKTEE